MSESTASAEPAPAARPSNAPACGPRPTGPAGETVSYDPATLEEVGRVPNTDLATMPDIMARARAAQKDWAACSFSDRGRSVEKMRDYIVEHAEELAAIVSRENGK